MTGRVCPVHGEWSASGVCRWCEPWRLEWTEPYIDAETHAAEESRLATEHAALRWERVARRWNYKHRGGGGTEEGRAYVWRWWLEQMDRSAAGLPLAGPFPLGFYAW